MAEYYVPLVLSFCGASIFLSACTRGTLLLQKSIVEVNCIIPLSDHVNQITIKKENKSTWCVKNWEGKKLYEMKKFNGLWHLQTMNNRQTLATIKHNFTERYIVLNHSPSLLGNFAASPLNTTPSVIKMNRWTTMMRQNRPVNVLVPDFEFGTNLWLRWDTFVYHLDIMTKNSTSRDGGITIHERVASVTSYDESNGYHILFDYHKINLEILVSTFLLARLCCFQ